MLHRLLDRIVREGTLIVHYPSGAPRRYGQGAPEVAIRITDPAAAWAICLDPELKLGEMYMDGRLLIEEGDIVQLLDLLVGNVARHADPAGATPRLQRLRRAFRMFMQFNPAFRARAHVAHHYDLSARLYDLFLDESRQYSCAYFAHDDDSLEAAQEAKKKHIAAKLKLDRPGLKVLDIGCGWGGLAVDLARDHQAEVLGITLSTEQIEGARERARQSGLSDRCHFSLTDYRKAEGRFDRIVSVGMFEHVGLRYYKQFFAKARQLLADDGVMLLHAIGRADGPGVTNAWIRKYVFPGGYAPALSEVMPVIEKSGLIVTDVEVLRLHYARTLAEWQKRFQSNRTEIAKLYDERFCRMWEFYLAGAEMAFRHEKQVVHQIQIAKRVDVLPLTRDYMSEPEGDAMPRRQGVRAAA